MKTPEEIKENIEVSKVKLQESIDNEIKFKSVMTTEMRSGYHKTQAYIRGWINGANGDSEKESNNEYMIGYKNGNDWVNSK